MLDDIIQNPFPGLRAFEEEEDILFFGREKQVDELLKKLRTQRFLTVIGSSGSGKSSLVKSGLIPSLHSGFMSGVGSNWKICSLRPGVNPIGNLARALSQNGILYNYESNDDEQMYSSINESVLRRSNFGLIDAFTQSGIDPKINLLILVDQFEELFRFIKFEKEAKEGKRDSVAFINLLLKATEQRELPIYVVFTMRSDFLGDCTEFRGLPEAINEGQYLVPRMTREERRDAIVGPVGVGGASISPRLLNQLLNDVGDNPDQLPILQHALMRTWDAYKKNNPEPYSEKEIDLDDYIEIGTMEHALSQHAEEAYAELETPDLKQICESIFRALTERGADSRGVRRPSQLSELCMLSNAKPDQVIQVIEIFRKKGRGFLMPPVGVPLTEDSIIDISHESIMRVWERLILWVEEENLSASTYLRLCEAAELYEAGKGGLLRDPELQVAWNWKQENSPNSVWASRYNDLFDKAILYLDHSKEQSEKELLFKEKRQKERLKKARRITIIISIIAFAAFLLAVYSFELRNLATKQTVLAEKESEEAKKQRKLAENQKIIAQKSQAEAEVSAKQALIQKTIAIAEQENAKKSEKNALLQKLIAEQQKTYAERQKVISEQNAEIARQQQGIAETQTERAVSNEKIAKEQTLISSRLKDIAQARNLAYEAMMLLNDNKQEESRKNIINAYKLNTENTGPNQNSDIYNALHFNWIGAIQNKNQFSAHQFPVRCIAQGPSNNQLISIDESGMLYLLKADRGIIEPVSSYNLKAEARSVVTSPDGNKALVVTSAGIGILLDISSSTNSIKEISRITFEGIGKLTLFKNNTEFAILTNRGLGIYSIGSSIKQIKYATGIFSTMTYRRNGNLYLVSGNKASVYTSSDNIPQNPETVISLNSRITSIAISPGGDFLAAGTYDGGIYLRDLNSNKVAISFTPHASSINDLKFNSVNGNLQLASASSDQTIKLMDVGAIMASKNTEDILTLRGHNKWVYSLIYTPDGKFLYTASEDKRIIGWHTSMAGIFNSLTSDKN
jgi:WD40 repeat protein/energy-coupling factor transporter ATP-binding protein EcfA2